MINHPPQVSFDSVRLYNSAGTRIHNYELINALSPWHFSETYANSLGSIILFYGYPAMIKINLYITPCSKASIMTVPELCDSLKDIKPLPNYSWPLDNCIIARLINQQNSTTEK